MKTNTMNASSPRLRAIARASGFSILAATTRRLLVPLQLQLHLHLHLRAALIAVAALLLASCATHTVKSTTYTPIQRATETVAEEFLLDIGVAIFDPGLDNLSRREEETTNAQIRVAESRYAPYMLAETLQRSGNWGIVRVLPNDQSPIDVVVNGMVMKGFQFLLFYLIHILFLHSQLLFLIPIKFDCHSQNYNFYKRL